MIIRNLKEKDFETNFLYLFKGLTEIEPDKISKNDFNNLLNQLNENHQIIVFEEEGKILASGTILIETKFIHNMGKVGHIEDVVVDKETRGRGLGKKIVEELTKVAKEKGCYKVILNCSEENIGFYQKSGFEQKNYEMVIRLLSEQASFTNCVGSVLTQQSW